MAAALLLLGLVLQLVVPRRLDLPVPPVIQPFRLAPLMATPSAPVATGALPFGPPHGAAAGAATPALPLGGAVAAGLVIRRGAPLAFVQAPDGTVTALAPGMHFQGWRLESAGGGGLRFTRDGQRLVLPFGARAAAAPQ